MFCLKFLAISTLILFIFINCGYGHKPYSVPEPAQKDYSLYSIEVDDYGTFWNHTDAQNLLNKIESSSNNKNTIILLFVHGWHHNAKPNDENYISFKHTLNDLSCSLKDKMFVESRLKLTNDSEVNLIGIYVGWRGRSLPCFLDYLTVWPRKSTAEKVGSGDLREFLLRLNNIYNTRNNSASKHFCGLITVGHSLGGQVLLKSVIENLENQLILNTKILTSVDRTPTERCEISTPLTGIGDITLLMNPATESYQFNRLHELLRQCKFNKYQTPVLMVISGEDDGPRKTIFPISRAISLAFKPGLRKGKQNSLWHSALGEYDPHRTHTLNPTNKPDSLTPEHYSQQNKIIDVDFSGEITLGGAILSPIEDRRIPFSPVIVAYSDSKLIEGHNGIFTDSFRQFISDYVGYLEGKRMNLRELQASAGSKKAK